jgi:hypothetical protein
MFFFLNNVDGTVRNGCACEFCTVEAGENLNEVNSSRDFNWFVQTLLSLLLIVKYPRQALREIVIEQKNSEKKLQIVDVVHLVSLQEDLKKVHCEGLKISSKLLCV